MVSALCRLAVGGAAALEVLDLADQELLDSYGHHRQASVEGLHLLEGLAQLRSVNLMGFRKDDGCVRYQAANPQVDVSI